MLDHQQISCNQYTVHLPKTFYVRQVKEKHFDSHHDPESSISVRVPVCLICNICGDIVSS